MKKSEIRAYITITLLLSAILAMLGAAIYYVVAR